MKEEFMTAPTANLLSLLNAIHISSLQSNTRVSSENLAHQFCKQILQYSLGLQFANFLLNEYDDDYSDHSITTGNLCALYEPVNEDG
jgi:hypothetical protein